MKNTETTQTPAASDLSVSTGSLISDDEAVELVDRLEYKIFSICNDKALRSRIMRAVMEFSEGKNLYFEADKRKFENVEGDSRAVAR